MRRSGRRRAVRDRGARGSCRGARYFPGMTLDFSPSPIAVPQPVLDDLRERLARTRLPHQVAGADWEMGTELEYLESLLAYWKDSYDWRAHEARFNAFDPTVTEVDGQPIHFLHARSP